MKLSDVVRQWTAKTRQIKGHEPLRNLALQRCEGTGHQQYVSDLGERWETVPTLLLAQDIREELADALNYTCALVERTDDAALLDVVPCLALAYQALDAYPPVYLKEASE